jgi:hypothetical protein
MFHALRVTEQDDEEAVTDLCICLFPEIHPGQSLLYRSGYPVQHIFFPVETLLLAGCGSRFGIYIANFSAKGPTDFLLHYS